MVVVGAVVVDVVVVVRLTVVVVGAVVVVVPRVVVVVVRRVVVVVEAVVVDVVDVVDVVVEEEVDEVVVGAVEEVVVFGTVDGTARSRSRSSGEAVYKGATLIPSCASFITSEKICAGNDPPVTARPWTSDIGALSLYPTHTAVASCGV